MVVPVHPKKWFLCALMLMLFFSGLPVWAGEEGVVTGKVVNLRSGPGLNHAVVAKMETGQGLTVLERSGDWMKVSLYNGSQGWVHNDYVAIRNIESKVKVTGDKVNLRKGPGTNYAKAGEVRAGVILPVLKKSNDWYLVDAPGVGQAWIAGWLTALQNEPAEGKSPSSPQHVKIKTVVLNVRSGPGTNYGLVTKIGLNEIHPVLEQSNGWYKIQVGNTPGWVSGDYVELITLVNEPPNQDTPGTATGDSVVVTGSVVNVRQSNSMESGVIGQVYAGNRLTVTGSQGEWLKVVLPDGKTGWIAVWLTNAASSDLPSRGSVTESEVLIAPITGGRTFKVIDAGGRPVLQLEGWANNQYQIKTKNNSTIVLELEGPCERNYEGKITRLGINGIKIAPQGGKGLIEINFAFAPTQAVSYDSSSKITRVQIGALQAKGLNGKVIVVDPGHSSIQPGGWLDPGAIGKYTGLKEKDVNIDIAFKLKRLLEQAGARVIMTHSGQTDLSLAGRAWIANNAQADIFVSIHANYSIKGNVSGHTTYYYAPASNYILYSQRYTRQKLATLVQRELVKAGGRADMGALQENFAVLRETTVPSILVETAFLSDRQEESLLATDAYRQRLAEGIFNGISAYFQ